MRNRALLALLAVIALFGAACGGDDDDEATADDDDSEASESDETESDEEESESGDDGGGGGGDFCEVADGRDEAFDTLGEIDPTTDPDALRDAFATAEEFFDDAVSAAPDDIADDVQTTADFFGIYADLFDSIGYDFGGFAANPEAAQELAEIDVNSFIQSQVAIETWVGENCG